MGKGINKVILVGNLGADPKMSDKIKACSFSIATSESWKDKDSGEMQERTEWHNITCFGPSADNAAKYLRKGSKVYVEGKLKTEKYEKEGQDHWVTKVIAGSMQMLDGKSDGAKSSGDYSKVKSGEQSQDNSFNDDDIPF